MHTILIKLLNSEQVSINDLSTEIRGEGTANIIQFCFIKLDAALWGPDKDPELTPDIARIILGRLLNLLLSHQSEFTESRHIATVFHRLGYIVQHHETFPELIKPYKSTFAYLMIALSNSNPNAQEISNSFFGLGYLKDFRCLSQEPWQTEEVQLALLSLLELLVKTKPRAQGIANTVYGVAKLEIVWSAENKNSLDRILLSLLKEFLELERAFGLAHIPKPKEIASIVYTLGYLSEQSVLLLAQWQTPQRQEILLTLYQNCSKKMFTAIGIAQIFYGFGKLAEDRIYIPVLSPSSKKFFDLTLLSYIDKLPEQYDLSARVINTVVYGLGRLARARYLDAALWKEANQKLKSLIIQKPFTDLLDSSNLLRGLGRLAEYNCLQPNIWSSEPNILPNLLDNIVINKSTNPEQIATLFYSIGKLLDYQCIPPKLLPKQQEKLKELMVFFLNNSSDPKEHSWFYTGLSKMRAANNFAQNANEQAIEIPSGIDLTSCESPNTRTPGLELHYEKTQPGQGGESSSSPAAGVKFDSNRI